MSRVFTDYVRALAAGASPDPNLFEAVWKKLQDALSVELRKRGLWNALPSYVGLYGYGSWSEEAFDELVADVFTFLLDRLPSLKAQLKVRDNVEGFFFRCIHNFLYDTQKKHDPVGFRVFTVAQAACRALIDDATLHVLEGDPGVKNDTVLGFKSDADPGEAHLVSLDEHAQVWNTELMPGLVTAKGKHVDDLIQRLAALISGLLDAAIELFRFHGLVGPLKSDARKRWNAIWAEDVGEKGFEDGDGEDAFPVLVRLIRPDPGVEERESFGKLFTCVEERLDGLDVDPKTLSYLRGLWTLLRNHAAESPNEGAPSSDTKASKLPSGRKIAQQLGIPRDRLQGLFGTLGELVEDCQTALISPCLLRE